MRALLPTAESIQASRWLRWMGPALQHPGLWRVSRRGLALGMSLGMFFGLLIPLAQIPLSAAAAVALRANVPAAVASTLISNPLTFAPIYYAAWRMGSAILGEPSPMPPLPSQTNAQAESNGQGWWKTTTQRIKSVGKPLLLGISILATVTGITTYFVVSVAWRLSVMWRWKRRHRRR